MDVDVVLALLGAFGIGTLLATVAQHVLTQRARASDRLHLELRESFAGLLQSISELDRVAELGETKTADDDARSTASFNYWFARVQLVASDDLVRLVRRWWDSDDEEEMNTTIQELLLKMRDELRVA
jgi:hypothetical protein